MKYKYYELLQKVELGSWEGLPNTQSCPTLEKAVLRDCDLPFRGWVGKLIQILHLLIHTLLTPYTIRVLPVGSF